MRRSAMLGILLLTAMLSVATPAQAQPSCTWSWTDLTVPSPLDFPEVTATDGHGRYAGTAWHHTLQRRVAVLWLGGRPISLGSAFDASMTVNAVNSDRVVVGDAGGVPVRYRAGQWERLPMPPGYTTGTATHINDNGDIAGVVGLIRVVLWPARNTYEFLDVPAVSQYHEPGGLMSDGTVAVWANLAHQQPTTSFLRAPDRTWTSVTHPNPNEGARITAVNDVIAVGDHEQGAVEWDRTGAVVRTYPGVAAVDVNSGGQILAHELAEVTIWRDGVREARLPSTASGFPVRGVAIDENGTVIGNREGAWPEGSRPVVARCA